MAKGFKCGAGSDFAMDLLWENASPSSEFAAQNITLDTAQDYSLLFVFFSPTATLTDCLQINPKNTMWVNASGIQLDTDYASANNTRERRGKWDSSTNVLSVHDCLAHTNGKTTVNNSLLKPYYIYGIK